MLSFIVLPITSALFEFFLGILYTKMHWPLSDIRSTGFVLTMALFAVVAIFTRWYKEEELSAPYLGTQQTKSPLIATWRDAA